MTNPHGHSEPETELEHEAYAWVVRFASGEANPSDLVALRRWAALSPDHAAAFDQASKVWQDVEPVARKVVGPHPLVQTRSILAKQPRLGRRAFLGGALAASAVGVAELAIHPPLGLWPSWRELLADYRTKPGEQRRVNLLGNVAIDMNTRTSISLLSTQNIARRIELISGEAIISAPPASLSLFSVLAANGRISASDARFDLRCDGQSACVTGLKGEIRIECGEAALSLIEGRQVTYSSQGFGQVVTVNPTLITAWQDGIIIFDATPVSQVVEEINRYRAGRVILTNTALGQERFSARFRISDIDGLVDKLTRVFGARATALPAGIVLLG